MLNINRADVEQMVKIIEYILDNESRVSIDQLMHDNGLTFEEYRMMSALAMPAIKRRNMYYTAKAQMNYYKSAYNKALDEREKLDEALKIAQDFLGRHFAPKPRAVVRNPEEADDGNGNDIE